MKVIIIIYLIIVLAGSASCHNDAKKDESENHANHTNMTVTVDTLKQLIDAFNSHDLDRIMTFFADDCTLDMPRGAELWGKRYTGKKQVREAFAGRFAGIPNVQYGDDQHWVSGDRGVSEWTLTGTTTAGVELKVRGCDLWEFQYGKIIRKNSYWKIVE